MSVAGIGGGDEICNLWVCSHRYLCTERIERMRIKMLQSGKRSFYKRLKMKNVFGTLMDRLTNWIRRWNQGLYIYQLVSSCKLTNSWCLSFHSDTTLNPDGHRSWESTALKCTSIRIYISREGEWTIQIICCCFLGHWEFQRSTALGFA